MTQSQPRKIGYDWAAYSELTVLEDDISQEYGKFVKTNKEAAEKSNTTEKEK